MQCISKTDQLGRMLYVTHVVMLTEYCVRLVYRDLDQARKSNHGFVTCIYTCTCMGSLGSCLLVSSTHVQSNSVEQG
jgi:hypothetical protein